MADKDSAYKKIAELVERFTEQYASYKKSEYNETLTRRDFIDPFFKALGWDIDNEQGYAEAYREVIHEDKIKVGKATKAPDYSFRLSGGKRLFFVEAKKPSVFVKDEILPAYQVRRYGWSAKLAVSIITDFEEFAIYDCTRRPVSTDKASVARIKYLTYKDYLTEFDFIWETFSKERVLKGSFDKFVQSDTYKKGTATVDKAFLESLDSWRTQLAGNIALRNKNLDEDEINFTVQHTLDRIIFLRIAEDRAIEPYGKLQSALKTANHYQNLFTIFKEADDKYNSGLFDFKKDTISKQLIVDDKVVKAVLNDLYYPLSPYEFSVIAVEILGSAYEQFLGKVIRITAGHSAKIEEKPEVRKAGGVYYTPEYVVDYIVENTVGKLVDGKTPKEVAKLKIVDPACGSGSFLLGAYKYLLNWYKDYYTEKGKTVKAKNSAVLTPEGNLTSAIKKQILLDNIYGVDIDVNAVEVTKLSLLLKCMEGETAASIAHQLAMFNDRILPTLDGNIKSGNSLIDTDYYDSVLDFGDEKKIKPFNWQRAFPQVFSPSSVTKAQVTYPNQGINQTQTLEEPLIVYNEKQKGGFDVVIGNPPYDVLEKDRLGELIPHQALQEYIKISTRYIDALGGKLNLFRFFIVKSIQLCSEGGRVGLIVPSSIVGDKSNMKTRLAVLSTLDELEFDCFPQKDNPAKRIFFDAKLSTVIFTGKKTHGIPEKKRSFIIRTYPYNSFEDKCKKCSIRFVDLKKVDGNSMPVPLIDTVNWKLLLRIHSNPRVKALGAFADDYSVSRGEINQTIYRNFIQGDENNAQRLLKGVEIGQYKQKEKLSQGNREWFNEKKFLKSNSERPIADQRRIATQRITGVDERLRIVATVIQPRAYFADSTNSIVSKEAAKLSLEYLLALLNSKLFQWRFKLTSTNNNVGTNELEALPVREIDFAVSDDKSLYKGIERDVNILLQLNEELSATKLASKIEQLQQRIAHSEQKVNEAVYKLYELTDEEIQIIEQSIKA